MLAYSWWYSMLPPELSWNSTTVPSDVKRRVVKRRDRNSTVAAHLNSADAAKNVASTSMSLNARVMASTMDCTGTAAGTVHDWWDNTYGWGKAGHTIALRATAAADAANTGIALLNAAADDTAAAVADDGIVAVMVLIMSGTGPAERNTGASWNKVWNVASSSDTTPWWRDKAGGAAADIIAAALGNARPPADDAAAKYTVFPATRAGEAAATVEEEEEEEEDEE